MINRVLDLSTTTDIDSKYILYDDKRFGVFIFDRPLNDCIRDLVYKYFRSINLDPFKVSFINDRFYFYSCELYVE